jgi:hypothetical protein
MNVLPSYIKISTERHMTRKTALHISKKWLSNIHQNKFFFFLSSPQTYTIVAFPRVMAQLIKSVTTLIFLPLIFIENM